MNMYSNSFSKTVDNKKLSLTKRSQASAVSNYQFTIVSLKFNICFYKNAFGTDYC